MVEDDHKYIAAQVNRNGGQAKYEFIPKMDHSLFWFENQENEMTDFYGKGIYKEDLAIKINRWMEETVGKR